ncbi:hypothetical protein ACE1TI_03315 [Alteribacillus sp. JSM 102045]|uniref:hypothetical protein n=1 Tax=Alteribacillus sp. JSM 102045 TaxID=1562101 RepID=UPI0035BEBBF8
MEEKFDSFFKQEGPFYPVQGFQIDSWKRAVQEVINEVVTEVLKYSQKHRTPTLLTEVFKEKWQMLSPLWFRHDTSYYLWLVHISGFLLPFLEKETGNLAGWIQYRQYPKAWSRQHFTVPIIKEDPYLTVYVFEKNPKVLQNAAKAMAFTASYSSSEPPEILKLRSMESGRTAIYRLTYTDKRKQG